MPRYAWVEGGRVRDYTDLTPAAAFHGDVAAFYDTVIPDTVERGWSLVDDEWTPPPAPPAVEPSPPQPWQTLPLADFLALFTLDEEADISTSTDPVVVVWYRRVQASPTVQRSRVLAGIEHLVTTGLLTQDRADAILAGDEP
ncbi:MAG: hypothetical protein ACK53W_12565 [Gemmatimonadota bacterium]